MAASLPGAERGSFLRRAERDAARLAKERAAWGHALAALILAGVAALAGDRERAHQQLERAARGCADTDMGLFEQVARRRQGELAGGADGGAAAAAATAWIANRGIADPDRITAMLAPGFPPAA
jgi:hypothetical protein